VQKLSGQRPSDRPRNKCGRIKSEIGCVKSVEHVRPELQARLLSEPKTFGNGDVEVVDSRGSQCVTTHGACIGQSATLNPMHGIWIHAWCARQIRISKPGRARRFNDGPGVQGRRGIADVRTFRCRLSEATAVGPIADGEGEPGLPMRYSSESPASKHP